MNYTINTKSKEAHLIPHLRVYGELTRKDFIGDNQVPYKNSKNFQYHQQHSRHAPQREQQQLLESRNLRSQVLLRYLSQSSLNLLDVVDGNSTGSDARQQWTRGYFDFVFDKGKKFVLKENDVIFRILQSSRHQRGVKFLQ